MKKPPLRRLLKIRDYARQKPHRARMLRAVESLIIEIGKTERRLTINWTAWPRFVAMITSSVPHIRRIVEMSNIEVLRVDHKGSERVFLRRRICEQCGKAPAEFGQALELCERCFESKSPVW